MKLFTTQSTKLLDQLTLEYEPIDSIDLMERAAEALTEEISKTVSPDRRLYIFAGPGNNGGDALATARLLLGLGYQPAVYLFNTMPSHHLSTDCARNCDRLRATGITQFYEITNQFTPPEIQRGDVIIDGLFGAGLHDPLSGGFASLARSEVRRFVCISPITWSMRRIARRLPTASGSPKDIPAFRICLPILCAAGGSPLRQARL